MVIEHRLHRLVYPGCSAERWRRVEAGEPLQHRYHVLGLAAPAQPDRQAEAAVLVDHVQEPESAAIGGDVELEIHRPPLVGRLGPVTPHRTVCRPGPLSLSGGRSLQILLPPDSLLPLVVHRPAPAPKQAVGHPAAPADVLSGDLPRSVELLGGQRVEQRFDGGKLQLTPQQPGLPPGLIGLERQQPCPGLAVLGHQDRCCRRRTEGDGRCGRERGPWWEQRKTPPRTMKWPARRFIGYEAAAGNQKRNAANTPRQGSTGL